MDHALIHQVVDTAKNAVDTYSPPFTSFSGGSSCSMILRPDDHADDAVDDERRFSIALHLLRNFAIHAIGYFLDRL